MRKLTNNWICVSGRYGLAAGPAGYFHYQAASGYQRVSVTVSEAGEAEDTLSFVEADQLAPRYAVWFPAKNALETSHAAAAIIWKTNVRTTTLTFPGLNGAATTMTALLDVPSMKYKQGGLLRKEYAEPSLKDVYKDDFLMGVALNESQICESNSVEADLVERQFNAISPENVLKWERIHPQPGTYDFKLADRYVKFGGKERDVYHWSQFDMAFSDARLGVQR